jgi:hypothetical protein
MQPENVLVLTVSSSDLPADYKAWESDGGLFIPPGPVRLRVIEEAKPEGSIDEFVAEYRGLFPEDYKGNKKKTTENMLKFFKEFKQYKRELILQVTKFYINECIKKQRFISQAHYFIYKRETGSMLEGYCERFANTGLSIDDLKDINSDNGRYR